MERNDIINELESGRLGNYLMEQAVEHLNIGELDYYFGLEYLTEYFDLRELFNSGLYELDDLRDDLRRAQGIQEGVRSAFLPSLRSRKTCRGEIRSSHSPGPVSL